MEADISHDFMGEFATYLFEDLAIGFSSSSTYLSSIKSQLEEKTRTDFFERYKQWNGRLRYGLRNRYVVKSNEEGVSLQIKTPLMTFDDLCLLSSALFKSNDPKALKDRSLVNLQWSLVGRSSDVGGLTYEDLQWIGEYLLVRVRQKTRQQHSLSLTPAAMTWEIDPIHSLAAQLAADPYNFSSVLFPQIAKEKGDQDHELPTSIGYWTGVTLVQHPGCDGKFQVALCKAWIGRTSVIKHGRQPKRSHTLWKLERE